MAVFNAFTAETAKNMQLDAGIIVLDLTTAELDTISAETLKSKKTIGATKGGAQFTATPEIRNIFEGIDGARGDYKGGTVIDSWEVVLKATISEMTAENLKLAICGADKGAHGSKYDKITPRDEIKDTDYTNSICWVGKQAGKEQPIIIELKNVLNTTGISFTSADKDNGSIEVEFRAHRDMAKPNDVPFMIYIPK